MIKNISKGTLLLGLIAGLAGIFLPPPSWFRAVGIGCAVALLSLWALYWLWLKLTLDWLPRLTWRPHEPPRT